MTEQQERQIVFVCQHGAFRSRLATAYFNAWAPDGWSAVSAGVTPQTEVSERLDPLLWGTDAAAFVDRDAPKALYEVSGERTIAIDVDAAGADAWWIGQRDSDEALRDRIRDWVQQLVRELADAPGL